VTPKQSPSELERWRDVAMDMQPISALGQLTQMVAHDLNNQFQSMVLHLEMLKPLGEQDEKVRKHITRIAEALDKAQAFVTYLRDVRMKSEKGSEANVKDVIEGIVHLMEGTFKRTNVNVEISCADDLPLIGMSMLLVHEVLLNVIMNAVEASENGGVLTIHANLQDDKVVVVVSDPGTGIGDEDSARVAEPFFTTKGEGHHGLGLTVANSVLSEAGGSMAFCKAENGGASVQVALPRAPHP